MPRRTTLALLALLLVAPMRASAEPPEDPWVGRTREEVIHLLGEPDGVQRRKGDEVLVYRLVRLDDDAEAVPGLFAFDLPGVGRVGRALAAITGDGGTLEIAPSEINRHGQQQGGGIAPSRSYRKEIRVGKDRDGEPDDRPGSRGRVKLRLRLDGEGRVRSWETSPKPRD